MKRGINMVLKVLWFVLLAAVAVMTVAEIPLRLCGVACDWPNYHTGIFCMLAIAFLPIYIVYLMLSFH